VTGSFQADGLAARLRLEEDGELPEALAELERGETESALDLLLAALSSAEEERRDDIRRVIVGELDALGPENPLARDVRSRLATALY
jgi:putative thioredoxin